VLVAVSLDEVDSTISRLEFVDAVVGGIVVLALVVLTYLAVWLGMRPLSEMEDAADAIARGDLSRRIDTATSSEEINKLAMAFNQMLERIQLAFIQVQESERLSKDSQDQLRRFVSNAGHELRTPLTSILGYSELLQSGIDSDMELVKGASRRIQQESQRMSGLVEELLLLASLDQRKPLRFERVDVLALVADGVQDARVIQPSRDIRLQTLHGNDDGSWLQPLLVAGDEQSLRQVISNLINNALFHTPIDSGIVVRLGISNEFSEIGPEVVVIEVEDYGPGIKEDAVVHLFERFYRVDDNRGYHNGGFGLGLSVVDSVVRAHGGSVSVDSVVGRGSRFTVMLPSFSPEDSKSEALQSGVNPL
jgi:two-component system OmpR family sensor kinase